MAVRQWPSLPLTLFLLWMSSVSDLAISAAVHDPPPPTDVPKPLPPAPKSPQNLNCTSGYSASNKIAIDVKPLPDSPNDASVKGTRTKGSKYIPFGKNCSAVENADIKVKGPGVSEVIPVENHSWKTRIIIACTVAAAVEVLIVIVMVMYWKQIRWTLRKFSCPCDERPTRRGHQAMEPTNSESPARVLRQPEPDHEDELEVLGEGHAVHTFSGPSTSRHGMVEEPEIIEETSSDEVLTMYCEQSEHFSLFAEERTLKQLVVNYFNSILLYRRYDTGEKTCPLNSWL